MLTLVDLPLLLAMLGVLMFAGVKLRLRILAAATLALWLAYGIYESLMQARILCTGECNIRVDLLLIYPVLLVLTACLLVGAAVRRLKRP